MCVCFSSAINEPSTNEVANRRWCDTKDPSSLRLRCLRNGGTEGHLPLRQRHKRAQAGTGTRLLRLKSRVANLAHQTQEGGGRGGKERNHNVRERHWEKGRKNLSKAATRRPLHVCAFAGAIFARSTDPSGRFCWSSWNVASLTGIDIGNVCDGMVPHIFDRPIDLLSWVYSHRVLMDGRELILLSSLWFWRLSPSPSLSSLSPLLSSRPFTLLCAEKFCWTMRTAESMCALSGREDGFSAFRFLSKDAMTLLRHNDDSIKLYEPASCTIQGQWRVNNSFRITRDVDQASGFQVTRCSIGHHQCTSQPKI